MNGIQGIKPARRQWNQLLDAVVTMMKYKKCKIDHTIYIKVLSGSTVSYLTVSTDDVLDHTNNKTVFPDLRRFLKEYFEIKSQKGSFLKYLNFRIYQPPLGFSIDHTDNIMELVK